ASRSSSVLISQGDRGARDESAELGCHCDVEASCRVGCGVNGAEAVDADTGVALGRFETDVAEHLGHVADVGAAFEHEGRDGMAEEMAAPLLVDPGDGEVLADLAREPVRAEWRADRRDEQTLE